ncbi:MAG: LLM class flavin-dependent oxidoreductase [Dehalococcoidia bacterium]|jgi:probable LLM family oxidoreductase
MTDKPFEIGVSSFADTFINSETGERISDEQRLANLLEEIELADKVGLDVFGVGEHHRPDFAASSPATILAAAAAKTKNIKLTSAVTVLSTDDPVRVFQQFSTVDLLSHGRAELTAGRGSFTESYPLFGYDLDDYDELFQEKLELLLEVRDNEKVTWAGQHRPGINNRGVYPRPAQEKLPVWIGVGGNPASVERGGRLGLPLIIAIIGGAPARFAPLVEYYRESARAAGIDPATLPVAINSHAHIAEDSRQAADQFWPHYGALMNQIGRERGWSPMTRNQFESLRSPMGALFVGSPDEVVEKVLYQYDLFGHDRFVAQMGVGPQPHEEVLKAIELLGTKVAPRVREEVAKRKSRELAPVR